MSSNLKLFQSVSSIPSLAVALGNMVPAERLPYLVTIAKGLPVVDGLTGDRLDEEILRHIGFIFDAIDDLLIVPNAKSDLRFEKAMELARWYVRNQGYLHAPKAMAKLLGEAAAHWATESNIARAKEVLVKIAKFYLEYAKEVGDLTRSAVNKACSSCSPERLAWSIVALDNIRTWNFGESIFDSIAVARVRKLITSRPTTVVREARMQAALGESPSCEAESAVLAYAAQVAKLDATATSLFGYDPNVRVGCITGFDVDEMTATVTIMIAESPLDEAINDLASSIRLRAQSWPNPHHDEASVTIECRNSQGVYKVLAVGGIATPHASAA